MNKINKSKCSPPPRPSVVALGCDNKEINSVPGDGGPRSLSAHACRIRSSPHRQFFCCTSMKSYLQTYPRPPMKSYPKFRNPRTTFQNIPLFRPKIAKCRGRGSPLLKKEEKKRERREIMATTLVHALCSDQSYNPRRFRPSSQHTHIEHLSLFPGSCDAGVSCRK